MTGMPPRPDEAASRTPGASSSWCECLLFLATWGVETQGDEQITRSRWPLGRAFWVPVEEASWCDCTSVGVGNPTTREILENSKSLALQ